MALDFVILLLLTSIAGFLRETAALPIMLALHLGAVMALFATLPYDKFAHALLHAPALLNFANETRLPIRLSLGAD